MAKGETIVGDSSGYQNALPKPAQRGPDKSPIKKQVADISLENQALKTELSDMRSMFIQLQQQMSALLAQGSKKIQKEV